MSTYTKRRIGPQGQYNTEGQRQDNVYTQAQHGVIPGMRADGVDRPFPNKPVSHRRPLNPRTQDSLDLHDLEKITITEQPRGSHHLNGIRETTGSQQPRKDSHILPSGELQMARAIHAKELMLQEKLWRVEEKIRQKIQWDSVEAAAGNHEVRREKERHDRTHTERGKAQTKTRLSEQQKREAVRGREMLMQERRQEDVKQLRRKQDQRNDRTRNTYEDKRARWKRGETEGAECPQSKREGNKGTYITVNKQKNSGELNKSSWESVKEHTRGKEDEKDHCIWEEAGVRPQDGIEKAKEIDWTREKKYRERTSKGVHCPYDEQDMPQISQQKTAQIMAMENHRGAERKISRESSLPPVSNPPHSSRQHKEELGLMDSMDASFQLVPCRICNRKFASKRLEKHIQVCEKVKQSHRQVFNSYLNRTKGSAIEEFWKTHSRSKTPEVGR